MIPIFLSHISKRFFRSSSASKDIAIQILLGIIASIVVAYLLVVGFQLKWMLVSVLKEVNPISFLNKILLYYFITELIIRYLIQSLPGFDVQAYLHLPIRRSRIVNFVLGRSVLHLINLFIFLLFTPFAFTVVVNEYGTVQALVWLMSLWFVSMIIHFIVMLFKQKFADTVWGLVIFICVGSLLAAADHYKWVSLSSVSATLFDSALVGYRTFLLLVLSLVLLYIMAYQFIIRRLYPEELNVEKDQNIHNTNWAVLRNFGTVGTLIAVELKMIFRNKRSREVFFLNFVFFFQALIFYSIIKKDVAGGVVHLNTFSYGPLLFLAVMSVGFFALFYGQFLYGWQAQHFDFTLTQPVTIHAFIESKYWLLTVVTVLWFLLSIPFVYLGWHVVLLDLVATLYNIGINIFIIMNMAMWGAKKLDLSQSGTLNYEGMGAAQWLIIFPTLMSPYLIYLPFAMMGFPDIGLLAVGAVGLVGIVFKNKLIDLTTRRLYDRRYTMASSFRKE